MKKQIFLLLIAVLTIMQSAFAYNFSAVAPSGQTLYYSYVNGSSGNCVYVTNPGYNYLYTKPSGELSIPSSVSYYGSSYSVTGIDMEAFYGCTGLTSVTIPSSVKSIGDEAFSGCIGLTSVIIGDSVTSIGEWAFSECTGLTSVTIPNSVTSIDDYTFSGCTGLTSVTIPNTVTSIGEYAFSLCTGLTTLSIPNSVSNIGEGAFIDCTGLTSIIVSANNIYYDSRDNCNAIIVSATNTLVIGCKNTVIPNNVTSIGEWAFSECTGLTSVDIPNSVTSIGEGAFRECTGLTSITIPSSVTSIGYDAFGYVRHIEYYGSATGSPWGAISMNGVTEGDFVYADNTKQQLLAYIGSGGDVTIPSTVNTIGARAFYNCVGLSSVTIPNSVTSIGDDAFYGCIGLTSVTIPDSVTSIGDNAFYGCRLDSLTIGCGLTLIGAEAFQYDTIAYLSYSCPADIPSAITAKSRLATVIIGDSVTSISRNAFSGCTGLTSITIPNAVTSIGEYAFSYCTGLTSVTIGSSVTSIGEYAFSYCTGLTTLSIPNSVTNISNGAFYVCSGLASISIGNGVSYIGNNVFLGCHNLTTTNYMGSVDQWNAISIQSNPIYLSHNLYLNNALLTNLVFSNTTHVINENFSGDTALTTIIIPNSVTSICGGAFNSCTGLTSVTIGNSVTSIDVATFGGCTNLTSVNIGSSVTNICERAFYGCNNISDITSLATTAPQLGTDAFYNVSSTIDIHIPCGSMMSYYSRWTYFNGFIEASGFSLSATSADETMGQVNVLTQPTCQLPIAVINATASTGYRFDHWSDNNQDNPRTLTLTSDTIIVGYFAALMPDTIYVYDTTYITLTDTVTVFDTVTIYDTITVYDTIIIYDTVSVGIDGIETIRAKIYQRNGQVVVEGANGNTVTLYDINGRVLATKQDNDMPLRFDVPATGTYMIKIGSAPARRVVVIR